MKFEIKNRFTGKLIFEFDGANIKVAVEAAVSQKVILSDAYLRGAYLRGADLSGAYLRGAYLRGADLSGAYLRGADLRGADLRGAYLRGADLSGAYLRGADLSGAYLRGADLSGAYLSGAYLRGADLSGALISDDLKLAESLRPIFYCGPIGSDADELIAFLTEKGIYLRRGCFFGTLDEFKAAVKKKHAKNEHGKQYTAALEMIELHFKLWPANSSK